MHVHRTKSYASMKLLLKLYTTVNNYKRFDTQTFLKSIFWSKCIVKNIRLILKNN